jgi:hypothetical protein
LAYDPERLQFIADFKTTRNEPGSLFVISSRFHRYFLKNIDPKDINIRIMRISNVVPSRPVHHFNLPGVPQYPHNTLGAFPTQPAFPAWPQYQQPHYPQPQFPQAQFPQNQKVGFGFYNPYAHPQVPVPSPTPFNGLAPARFPQSIPTQSPVYPQQTQRPQIGGYNHPYVFEQFGLVNKNVNNPFYQLNTGEIPVAYQHLNQGYRPNKPLNQPFSGSSNFLRRTLFNSTIVH